MATYKQIFGKQVKFLSADPANESEGQIWYNSTSGTFKSTLAIGAWSSATGPTRKNSAMSSGGTQTAAILSGATGANPPKSAQAEDYNGTSWTNLTDMPAAYGYNVGCGTTSDFSSMGGGYPTAVTTVFDWDSSSWTTGAALPAAKIEGGCCGPGQQALFAGGANATPGDKDTYERDGASWTVGGDMNTAKYAPAVSGTKTSALSSGGVTGGFGPPGYRDVVESYNGTGWTNETSTPVNRAYAGCAGTSSDNQLLFGGGNPGTLTSTVKWDGTAWSTEDTLATARSVLGGFGSTTAALASCGNAPSPGAAEEWDTVATVQTLTTS